MVSEACGHRGFACVGPCTTSKSWPKRARRWCLRSRRVGCLMACTAVGPWQHQATAGGRAGSSVYTLYIRRSACSVYAKTRRIHEQKLNKGVFFVFFFKSTSIVWDPSLFEWKCPSLLAPRCAVYHVRRFRRVTFTNICATGKHGRPPVSCESAIRKDKKKKKGGPPHPRPSLTRAGSVWRICKKGDRRFSANQRAPSTQPTSFFLSFCSVRLAWSKCRSSRPAACYKDSRAVG